ncbi:response regulator [Massilia sp. Dwa41.01b]|uniref:hypothetical protein n=1 Tax=Massilia sp. Dwa41.01b TaxID=2709302 RepID=UPI0015FEC175|nr:hypothetical protein [Massilia sp. Dwa41.01b]QNA89925.1 response regulator [Massilia sp. Dwa41.01b]
MATQRKTILVIHSSDHTPADIRSLLGSMGHIAVTVTRQAALKLLGTVRFDVIFTAMSGSAEGEASGYVQKLRALAPGAAIVGIEPPALRPPTKRGRRNATRRWPSRCPRPRSSGYSTSTCATSEADEWGHAYGIMC